jgi:4-amino-4-deoxy-L-arabinose transferase-like glycosyltransferase
MEVPQIAHTSLQRRDYLLLAVFALALFGCSIICGGTLTGHESVLPENTREMLANHDWLVPRVGGEPWLERPPLPDWIMAGIDLAFGRSDSDRIVRIGPVCMTALVVVLTAWMAGLWYGRVAGILSGLIMATMWEIFYFSGDPEADMFLCAIVTCALAFFVRSEFVLGVQSTSNNETSFGRRSWSVVGFFVFLGLTNLAKGLVFGTLMVLVPVAGYLLWKREWWRIRRYLWFWGALTFLTISAAWPVLMCIEHPEIVDLWKRHYFGRLAGGYIGEPFWYYLIYLPIVIMPWTLPALVGLWTTRAEAWNSPDSPNRFVWCWALLTPAFFSIPDGKHHHYLLHCLAPWAILAALGAVRVWQGILSGPAWLRRPGLSVLLIGLPLDLVLLAVGKRVPGPSWLVPFFMIAAIVCTYGVSWALSRPNGRLALGTLFTLFLGFYWMEWVYQTRCLDRYGDDLAFLRETTRIVAPEKTLMVAYDVRGELETFWVLFYSRPGSILLPEPTSLAKQREVTPEVYVLARAYDGPSYAEYGTAEIVLQSKHTRFESWPGERRTLFRIRFDTPRVQDWTANQSEALAKER